MVASSTAGAGRHRSRAATIAAALDSLADRTTEAAAAITTRRPRGDTIATAVMGITTQATASAVNLPRAASSEWEREAATPTVRISVEAEAEADTTSPTWAAAREAVVSEEALEEVSEGTAAAAARQEDITTAALMEALAVVISAVGPVAVALVTMAVQAAVQVGRAALAVGERVERMFVQSVMDEEDLKLMEERMEGFWSDEEEDQKSTNES